MHYNLKIVEKLNEGLRKHHSRVSFLHTFANFEVPIYLPIFVAE